MYILNNFLIDFLKVFIVNAPEIQEFNRGKLH